MKMDKAHGSRVAAQSDALAAASPPALIRAMANTLHDRDVDPLNSIKCVVVLVQAGYPAKDIHTHFEAVTAMAIIRKTNEERRR